MAQNIEVNLKERTAFCNALKKSGEELVGIEKATVETGDLVLDGVKELTKTQNTLKKLIVKFGNVVVKDAGILQKIADAFDKTDSSVSAP